MLGSPIERANSSGLSGTENQTPMILNCSIRCLAMASSSKAVVRHICGRVTNLICNTGLSVITSWSSPGAIQEEFVYLEQIFMKKLQKCQ